ncbi:MAG: hypothetical protein ABWJ42_00980 [Sulfolobales archaeon]
MKIFIEHLESRVSEWLLAEYKHSYRIAGNRLLITGIEIPGLPSTSKRFYELIDPSKVIILDPQAGRELRPEDLVRYEGIVIGGILGSHPPLGRTKKLLSDRFPEAEKRNIGEYQFSIDGSVYIVTEILRGRRLEEIPVVFGLIIKRRIRDLEYEIVLPYAYPLVRDRPLVSRELLKLLAGDEYEVSYGVSVR